MQAGKTAGRLKRTSASCTASSLCLLCLFGSRPVPLSIQIMAQAQIFLLAGFGECSTAPTACTRVTRAEHLQCVVCVVERQPTCPVHSTANE